MGREIGLSLVSKQFYNKQVRQGLQKVQENGPWLEDHFISPVCPESDFHEKR